MFDFFMDVILGSLLDLAACRFDFKLFSKHTAARILLGIGTMIFFGLLFWGINCENWFLILIGGGGSLVFMVCDWRYGIWWFKEGRFGIEPTWLNRDILPEGGINSVVTEEEIRRREITDVHRDMNHGL